MWMSYRQKQERGNKDMMDSWQCEVCGRHFTSTKNWIQLMRRVVRSAGSQEDYPYLDICTDCERWIKRGGLDR